MRSYGFKPGGRCINHRTLNHGYQTRGPPVCIMQPAATFVYYVYTIKIAQKFTRLHIGLIFFHARLALQPTIVGVTLCHKRLDTNTSDG
jgi:hypothetical protein